VSNAEGLPPGALVPLVVTGDQALAGFTSKQLVSELHARLRSGAIQGSDEHYDPDVDGFTSFGRELLRQLDIDSDRFSRSNAAVRFGTYWGGHPSRPTSFEDATVVELGCGSRNPLSMMFLFVLLGARRGIGVDLDGIEDAAEAARGLARCAGWLLTDPRLIVADFPITREQVARHLAATHFDLARLFAGDPGGIDRSRLEFRQESATRLGFGDGEVDLCCSTCFLEHVDDADAIIAEMARITRRGGLGSHSVDGVDHRSYFSADVRALEFLEIPTADKIVHGTNRLRPRSFVPIFERHGFEVQRIFEWRREEVDAAKREKFVEPFRSMALEDLACVGATLWVRRR
jgi:SAM-dependent methyltransferase